MRVTYLPFGSIAIEMRLGGVPSVVPVEVELKIDHPSVRLYESVWVGVQWNSGDGDVVRRGEKRYRWGWDEEGRG